MFQEVLRLVPPKTSGGEWEYERGRYEVRRCSILSAEQVLSEENLKQWTELKTIVKIEAMRMIGEKQSHEIRYYISDE